MSLRHDEDSIPLHEQRGYRQRRLYFCSQDQAMRAAAEKGLVEIERGDMGRIRRLHGDDGVIQALFEAHWFGFTNGYDCASILLTEAREGGFYLYRLLDRFGRVVYIGVTRNLPARLRAHRRKLGAAWYSYTSEEYPDAEAMLEAEAAAIHDEQPPLNHAGLEGDRPFTAGLA